MIYLSNPQAIIGDVFPREEIIAILEAAKESIVIVDEAYVEYCDGSVIDLVNSYENLIITRTFSKAFSIASMRLGYCISTEVNINEINKVKELLPESVNKFAQIAGYYALDDLEYMKGKRDSIIKARSYFIQEMNDFGLKAYDSQANYVLVNFGSDDTAGEVYLELEKNGVFVREVYSKPKMEGCLRIGMPLYEEIAELIEKIKQAAIKTRLSRFDTLLFDMDGVLVDVSNSYRLAIKKTAESFLEKEITFDDIQAYKERGGLNNDWDCVQAILKDNGMGTSRNLIISEFDRIYLGGAIDNERLIVKKTILEGLSKRYKLGIITGRPKRDADYTIDKLGLRKFFPVMITLDDVESGKPDPEGILKAMKILGAKKAAYFGDTVDDIIAAMGAGLFPVGVLPPGFSSGTSVLLKEKGAALVLKDINQLNEAM
jgi:HAD superfamily phosphatase